MDRPIACTIASNNYLAYARVFARSFLQHHPDGEVYGLIVDRRLPEVAYAQEPFQVLFADEIGIPAFSRMAFRYSILELNTAVKPFLLADLHRRTGCRRLCYFDPDIRVLSDLSELYGRLETSDVLLTPHITEPIADAMKPGERDFLSAGIYNLGFMGLAFNERTAPFLEWWQQRLYSGCLNRPDRGLFVDQRWMDFAPAFLPGCEILREPGTNMAYWNLVHRRLERDGDGWRVGDAPLRFFHFSRFDPERPEVVAGHQNRYTLNNRPDLEPLLREYAALVMEAGHEVTKRYRYGYGTFDNGVPIPQVAREVLRQLDPDAKRWADPFATEVPDSFYDWLRQPVDPRERISLPRIALCFWDQERDVQHAFPVPTGRDLRRFAVWFVRYGARAVGIDDTFGQHLEEALRATGVLATEPGYLPFAAPERFGLDAALSRKLPGNETEPLTAPGPQEQEWFTAPVDYELQRRPRIPRLAMLLREERPDLIKIFPDPLGASREDLAYWYVTHGRHEYRLHPSLVLPVLRSFSPRQRLRAEVWWRTQRPVGSGQSAVGSKEPVRPVGSGQPAVGSKEPAASFRLPTAGCPLPTAHCPLPAGLNVVGWPGVPTGVGEMCRGTLAALDRAGVAHAVWELDDPDEIASGRPSRGGSRTAPTEPELPFEVSLYHVNAGMIEKVRDRTPRGYEAGRYRIGYWFWELSHFPLAFAESFRCIDELWAPSRFCLDAFRALSPVPVRWVPPCVPPAQAGAIDRGRLGVPPERFLFFNAFDVQSVPERKNPFGLLDAFDLAVGKAPAPVHLLLKINHADEAPDLVARLQQRCDGLPVTLFIRPASRSEVSGMMAACDAYVSLHRSEGLGVPLIEAMSAGKPVIATAYGGCTDFLDEETGWGVRYDLATLEAPQGPYPAGAVWAEPDVEHAAALMAEVAGGAASVREKTRAAATRVAAIYSPAAAGERFKGELLRIFEARAVATG